MAETILAPRWSLLEAEVIILRVDFGSFCEEDFAGFWAAFFHVFAPFGV
jgi:hypothetical protein